jgi:hypothetical protein
MIAIGLPIDPGTTPFPILGPLGAPIWLMLGGGGAS